MAKKKEVVESQEAFEAALQSETKVFDAPLLGIVKTKDGKFAIVKVMVDSKSLDTSTVEVIESAESKFEANDKFKINVVRQGIL